MDEDVFRNYFIKLYKSLSLMESEYLKVLSVNERTGFQIFTKSLDNLASHFKCVKEHKNNQDDSVRPSKKNIAAVATKMIFGLGEV